MRLPQCIICGEPVGGESTFWVHVRCAKGAGWDLTKPYTEWPEWAQALKRDEETLRLGERARIAGGFEEYLFSDLDFLPDDADPEMLDENGLTADDRFWGAISGAMVLPDRPCVGDVAPDNVTYRRNGQEVPWSGGGEAPDYKRIIAKRAERQAQAMARYKAR